MNISFHQFPIISLGFGVLVGESPTLLVLKRVPQNFFEVPGKFFPSGCRKKYIFAIEKVLSR